MSQFDNNYFDTIGSSMKVSQAQVKIKDKCKWPIFVYDWINKTPNTEAGLKAANEPRTPHYQWTEIIKGNESVYLSPINAIKLTKHQGTGKIIPGTRKVDGSYYNVEYSKEDSVVFYGAKDNAMGGNNFSETTFGGFGDFTTIGDSETITFKTLQKVSKDMLTKFFFIPDVAQIMKNNNAGIYDQDYNDNDIFFISSYTNYFDENTNKFIYSEITFSNLQQNMAQSGQIIEQHIYLSSPGAGYLVPKLLFDKEGKPIGGEKGWEWNTNFTQDKGVKTIQIEVSGNYAFCALEIWGYPVDPEHNDIGDKRWYAPRKLLVEHLRLPLNENFYKVSPNNSEFVIADGKLTATADLKAYKTLVHNFAGDDPMDYQGIINTTKQATRETNLSGYTINDEQFGFSDKFLDSLLETDGKTKNDDFNNFYVTDSQWFYDGQKADGTDGIGQKTINFHNIHRVPNNDHSAVQLLNIMSFALQAINRLPLEISSKLSWSMSDMPGFGGFLNKALLGMSPIWRTIVTSTNVLMPKLQTIPMFINKDFYDLATNSVYESNALNKNNTYFVWDLAQFGSAADQTTLGKIPMDFFQKAESDRLGAVLSNKSNSSTLTFTLTDKIQASAYDDNDKKKENLVNISSVLLNQNVDGERYKVDETSFSTASAQPDENVLTDVNGDRYIITNIGFKGLGDGDVRITCFNDDVDNIVNHNVDYHEFINFQTYMKTTAAFKNNQIREWHTNLNTSYLDFLDKYINEKFDWPKALPVPQPEYHLPDITGTRENISDYAIWRNASGVNNTNTTNITYTEKNKDDSNVFFNSSYNIELHDFANDGYKNTDDIRKNYEKINISSDQLSLVLGRITGISSKQWAYQHNNLTDLNDCVITKNWSPNRDGKDINHIDKLIFDFNISETIRTTDIIDWNKKDKIGLYAYENNIGSNINGSYTWKVFDDNHKPTFFSTTSTIKDSNNNKTDIYYFLYFDGTKLMINIFLEAKIDWLAKDQSAYWSAGGGYGTRVSAKTSLLIWIGKKGFNNINSTSDFPNINNSSNFPNENEQLLGHKTNYWNIKYAAISYKLGTKKK